MDLLSLTHDDLADKLEALGQPRFRARAALEWIYRRRAKTFEEMTDLPGDFRRALSENVTLRPLMKIKETGSKDTTRKLLFRPL